MSTRHTSEGDVAGASTVKATRRKLLRGAALTAPAVLTLPSAASAIAFDSATQCVRNMTESPDYLHVGQTDDFARQEVAGISVSRAGGGFNAERHVLVKYDFDYYVDELNRRWSLNSNGRFLDPDGKQYQIDSTTGSRYTVAWVNDDGQLLGVHPKYADPTWGGKAISGSCWISLLPK